MGLSTRSFALLAFLPLLTLTSAAKTSSTPTSTAATSATTQAYSAMSSEGCFTASGDMTDQGWDQYQSSLHCQGVCVALNKPVLGLSGDGHCWCGDLLPAANTKASDSQCSTTCNGYPGEFCGGNNAWTIWLDGLSQSDGSVDGTSTSSSSPLLLSVTSSAPTSMTTPTSTKSTTPSSTTVKATPTAVTTEVPQVVTVSGSTIVRTVPGTTILATPTAMSAPAIQPHSTNKAAIAAGAVVGVVALLAIVAGVFFFLRRRRATSGSSGGHRRATSIDAWSGAPTMRPTLPRLSTLNDSRLDPRVLNEKRKSGVSIFADNEDYSRRILKVTNPDGS